jgi:hypothetical protein
MSHVLLVNPRSYTLEVLRLDQGQWIVAATHDGDCIVRAEPFQAVPLALFRLWGHSAPES